MTVSARNAARVRARSTAALGLLAATVVAHGQQDAPGEWLDRMADAIDATNCHGTVIRRQRGESEALKVVHRVVDGVVNERLVSQEGNGVEIIRIGDEVHCILPDSKSVLVEGWSNQSTLFSALPRSEVSSSAVYDFALVREGRVAGRPAVLLAVRPHDEYRYAHRLWLDKSSGFPLQTEMLNLDGDLIEEIKFADIAISDDISPDAIGPSIDLDGFTWYREPDRYRSVEVDSRWICEDLPPGFKAVSTKTEQDADAAGGDELTHIVYSDGVANVSVFISAPDGEEQSDWGIVGNANSYTVQMDDVEITAVGEVPAITVQRIASTMRRR